MTDYQLGKIYRIVCNISGMTYYGSTCEPTLARRLAGHVGNYKRFKDGEKRRHMSSFQILESGNFAIVLVELFPCSSRMELNQRERYYIENNECVNKNIPTRTPAEYYLENKSRIADRSANYRLNNIDKIKITNAKQYQKRKEAILAKLISTDILT